MEDPMNVLLIKQDARSWYHSYVMNGSREPGILFLSAWRVV